MKQLIKSDNTIVGYFKEILDQDNGYLCDGVEYQFSVVGTCTVQDYDGELPDRRNPEDVAEQAKSTGIEILGVMCSATKDDQNGMVAVGTSKLMADMGGVPFADTVFEFTNGNKLVITAANFNQVYAAWVPFRQSFFAP